MAKFELTSSRFSCMEVEKLQQENKELQRQIDILKSQFNSSLQTNDQIQKVFQENYDLTNKVRASQAENDDISRRLQISLQKIQELTHQVSELKNEKEDLQQNYVKDMEKLKEASQSEYNKKVSCLKNVISEKEKAIQSFDSASNTYQYQLDQIFSAASTYFGRSINELEPLLEILLIEKPKTEEKENISLQPSPEPIVIKKDSKKGKYFEEKYNESEKLRKETEAALVRKIDSIIDMYEKKMKEKDNNINDLHQQIKTYKSKVSEYNDFKGEMMKTQSKEKVQHQLTVNEIEAQKLEEITAITKKFNNLDEQFKKEQEKSELLKKQLVITMKKYKNTAKEYDDLTKEMEKLKEANQQLNKDNQQLTLKNRQLELNSNDLNSDLLNLQKKNEELSGQNRAYSNDLNQRIVDLERLKVTISHLVENNNQIKSEIAAANADKQKSLEQVNDTIKLVEDKEKQIQKLNNELTDCKKEYNVIKQKLAVATQPINEDELLPLACWSCTEFPKELSNVLSDLARNRTLKAPTKLRHHLSMIAEWYNSQIERIEKESISIRTEIEKAREMKKEFAQSMKALLPTYEIDFTKIIDCCEERQKFVNFIQKMQITLNQAQAATSEKEAQLSGLLLAMQASTPEEAHSFIGSMSEEVNNLNDDVEKTLAKMEKQKIKFEKIESELHKQIDDCNLEIENLRNSLKSQEEINQKLKRMLKNQKFDFESKIQDYEHKMREINLVNEAKIIELQNANTQSLDIIAAEKQKTNNLSEEIQKLKDDVANLEKTNKLLTKQKVKEIKGAKELIKQMEDKFNLNEQKLLSANSVLKQKIEKMIEEYKLQIEDYKASIASLSESKQQNETKNNDLTSSINDLTLEKQKLVLQIQSLKNELEREKRLSETAIKTKETQLLADRNRAVEDMRVSMETQKRSLISKVANEFCTLFDVSTSKLDEQNFDLFMSNIRIKLNDLMGMESKLRVLLALGPQQSIVDAVSLLLLKT